MDVINVMSSVAVSIIILSSIALGVKVVNWVWLKPGRLEKFMRKQGQNGNPYRLFIGDMKDFITNMKREQYKVMNVSDDVLSHITPYYHHTIDKYGKNSFVWFGPYPRVNITDPQLMKEILMQPGVFQKPHPDPITETILGGLLSLEDGQWAKHRKIISVAFHLEKLKSMIPTMSSCCSIMMRKWEALLSNGESSQEIDVWPYIEDLSADIISRTAFGSSYEEGRRIFELEREQITLVLQMIWFCVIPGWRYFPTKANRRLRQLSDEIDTLLRDIISQREKAREKGTITNGDLLGILMESNLKEIQEHGNKNMGMSTKEVIEECKLFYFAGSESTSSLLVWTMVNLSIHQDWQVRAREEVLQVFGKERPTSDGLNRLKIVNMILQEVLRLYPPAPLIVRAPKKTVKLGNMILPKGVQLTLLIGQLHHDKNYWGDDVKEFKPERFSEGISSAAKTQFSFMPFSQGPRVCIGQNYSMTEAKIVLAMILQHFSFELSSSYKHAPFPIMTLQPQYGAPLCFRKL